MPPPRLTIMPYTTLFRTSRWKAEFLSNIAAAFNDKPEAKDEAEKVDIEKLYAQIGQLKVENDFLKKNCKKLGI